MFCTRCGVPLPRHTDRYCAQCGAPTPNVMLLPPPAGAPQRLLRSARDRRIGGVCGGFAEYFGTDPTLVRLLAVIATIFSGFFMGIFAYILCWIVIPKAQWWWTPAASPPAPPAPMSAAGPAPAPAA